MCVFGGGSYSGLIVWDRGHSVFNCFSYHLRVTIAILSWALSELTVAPNDNFYIFDVMAAIVQ